VNGDGLADLLVASTHEAQMAGAVRVFAGNDVFLGAEERGVRSGRRSSSPPREARRDRGAGAHLGERRAALLVIEVGPLDSAGQRIVRGRDPSASGGLVLGFRAFATTPTGIADSAQETIEIE
jgi:hypothetical protein